MMYYSGIDTFFFFSHLGVALGLWYVEMDDYHVHFVYVVPLKVAFYIHLVKMKVGGTPLSGSRLCMMHAVHSYKETTKPNYYDSSHVSMQGIMYQVCIHYLATRIIPIISVIFV